jgi:transcriptional regulator with XRE-family HTH domain
MATKTPEIRLILSKNLKAQRNKLGFSQEKFAEISGLSVQTINDIEGGRRWVSDKTITKLSIALNVECYQLLIPNFFSQNRKETTPTQNLMKLKEKMHKGVDTLIDAQFTDFIKAGLLK